LSRDIFLSVNRDKRNESNPTDKTIPTKTVTFSQVSKNIIISYKMSQSLAANVQLFAGGQLKTCALSKEININKELHTSRRTLPLACNKHLLVAWLADRSGGMKWTIGCARVSFSVIQ
jgi:hypothetical protein